jgi:hypothetical protein
MDEQMEPEILSYREFRNRETFREWERRRRAVESQSGGQSERSSQEAMRPAGASLAGALPPR